MGGFFCIFVATNLIRQSIMKKFLLSLTFFVAAFVSAHAQFYIGGSLNAEFNKDIKIFAIAPDVGYSFPNTPFTIACAVEYGGTIQNDEAYEHSLTLSPYFRYNICDFGERFTLFTDLSSDINILEFGLLNIGLCPGVSFEITDRWSAEFSIGFLGYLKEPVEDQIIKHGFEMELRLAAPSFGFYYSF